MKILHVSSAEVYGGIETILLSLGRWRKLNPGLEQHFALCFEGRLSEELRALGVPLHMLEKAWLNRPLSVLRARRALDRAMERSGCDAVVCHGPRSMICFASAVRSRNLPLVMWAHGAKGGRPHLYWLLKKNPPDLMICNSRYTRQAFTRHFPQVDGKVVYAPFESANALQDSDSRAAVRKELGTSVEAVVIVQAGRLVPLKGQTQLIDALYELRDEPAWQCWIAGGVQASYERGHFKRLVSRVHELGLADRIHFIGQRNDIQRIFSAADIYCQPNQGGESFGVVFIEAMATGLPVVTSAMGGALEIVDQQSGFLVPANDRPALVKVLSELLAEPDLRRRIGRGGPARVRELCDPAARLSDLQSALGALIVANHSPSNV